MSSERRVLVPTSTTRHSPLITHYYFLKPINITAHPLAALV